MERDWPEGRGIFHNAAKTFLLWVNEEDQMRIISMEKGGDVKGVFSRLARGIKAVGDSVKAECGKDFALSEQYGYIHSCPTNLGTGMRASVMIDLPGYTKEGLPALQKRCEELAVQPRGTRGESGGYDGETPIQYIPTQSYISQYNPVSSNPIQKMTGFSQAALTMCRTSTALVTLRASLSRR